MTIQIERQKIAYTGTDDDSQIRVVLRDVGIDELRQQGAFIPALIKKKLPAPAPEESRNYCSAEAVDFLQTLLTGEFQNLLPEFLRALYARDEHLPPEVMPMLLEHGHFRFQYPRWRDHFPIMARLMGERGRWLAEMAQHDYWILHYRYVDKFPTRLRRYLAPYPVPETIPQSRRISIQLSAHVPRFLRNVVANRFSYSIIQNVEATHRTHRYKPLLPLSAYACIASQYYPDEVLQIIEDELDRLYEINTDITLSYADIWLQVYEQVLCLIRRRRAMYAAIVGTDSGS